MHGSDLGQMLSEIDRNMSPEEEADLVAAKVRGWSDLDSLDVFLRMF